MTIRKAVVYCHQESEGWWAESPDAPGFTAVASDFDQLRERASEGIRFHFEGEKVPLLLFFVVVGAQEAAPVVWAGADIFEIGSRASAGPVHAGQVHADFVTEPMGSTDVKVEFTRT